MATDASQGNSVSMHNARKLGVDFWNRFAADKGEGGDKKFFLPTWEEILNDANVCKFVKWNAQVRTKSPVLSALPWYMVTTDKI